MTPLFLSLVPPIFVQPFFFPVTSGLFFPAGFFPVFLPAVAPIVDPPMQGFADPITLEGNQPSAPGASQVGNDDAGGSAGEAIGSEAAPPAVLLVFQDGSTASVTDYWLGEDWHVHYVTSDGGKHSVPLERLNLVKTSETNMRRGVNFSLDPASPSDEK